MWENRIAEIRELCMENLCLIIYFTLATKFKPRNTAFGFGPIYIMLSSGVLNLYSSLVSEYMWRIHYMSKQEPLPQTTVYETELDIGNAFLA